MTSVRRPESTDLASSHTNRECSQASEDIIRYNFTEKVHGKLEKTMQTTEKGDRPTVMCAMNAAGKVIPPKLISPSENLPDA